ncbi:MAG: YecA family protein [Gemmatimonadaceae bacterium]
MSTVSTGRNDPCPCGSGVKFKKCCGRATKLSTPPEVSRAGTVKAADHDLLERLLRFSRSRLERNWAKQAIGDYLGNGEDEIDETEMQLAMPWVCFHYSLPGHGIPLARLFADEKGARLSAELREVLNANLNAWLSIWEVNDVNPGVGVTVTDLLTGAERFVHEVSGTETMEPRSALLGRVVDSGGISFFGGVHPQPMPPTEADILVREGKRICRVRTKPARLDDLRNPQTQLMLIHSFRRAAYRLTHAPRPTLTNTDGDLLALTVDHFDILVADRSLLSARMSQFPGAEESVPDEDQKGVLSYTVTKPGNSRLEWDNTIVGRVVLGSTRMHVECNSLRRADSLRSALEAHLTGMVKHRLRQETSQSELFRMAEADGPRDRGEDQRQSPELAGIVREFKERHMAAWPDSKLPALGGLTPREAALRPRSRADLEVLLREMEMHEARLPEEERIDLGRLRDTLGMPD